MPIPYASESPATLAAWTVSIAASIVLWVATIAGNVALFAVHPAARHWPMLETVEALQVASLVPVARSCTG